MDNYLVFYTVIEEEKTVAIVRIMGDNWEHHIQLVRIIEDHDQESPYLLEAIGQTPPEDVGGVDGFVYFRQVMLNPSHPEYEEMRAWAKYWQPELWDWQKQPRVIRSI